MTDRTIRGPDDFSVPLVGESHYEKNLTAILAKEPKGYVDAQLVLEDSNPHDAQAVRVDVDGRTVGYLSRAHAEQYRRSLAAAGTEQGDRVSCRARIMGRERIGVWIDLPVQIGRLGFQPP
jgi:hypothetical protein